MTAKRTAKRTAKMTTKDLEGPLAGECRHGRDLVFDVVGRVGPGTTKFTRRDSSG
jgi:hypothetical protein